MIDHSLFYHSSKDQISQLGLCDDMLQLNPTSSLASSSSSLYLPFIQKAMEKPTISSSSSRVVASPNLSASSLPYPATDISSNQQQSRKPPTPEELVAHYQSQGLNFKDASIKAIQDLQAFLHDLVARRAKKQIFMAGALQKLDNISTRLTVLDMKLDSKPGHPQTISIGVAIGAAVKGVGFVAPHVAGAIGQMWDASRRRS